jgi:HEAT repeat protein
MAFAQDSTMTPAERLVEQERVRVAVESAFSHYYQPAEDGHVKNDNKVAAVDMMVEIGPAAVPLLANELQQALNYNHSLVAYSLGRIGGPEAEAALRDVLVDIGQLTSEFATTRRAWTCWALAMQGHVDALDLFNSPPQLAAGFPVHKDMSALEAAAMMLAPESVPVLHAQLDRYTSIAGTADDFITPQEEGQGPVGDAPREPDQLQGRGGRLVVERTLGRERLHVIRALRRLAHKDSLPKLIALLDDYDPAVRREAADALHVFDTPQAARALIQRLKVEPRSNLRFSAAWSLRQFLPTGHAAEFVELLDKEQDVHVRGALYHLVAASGGSGTFDALKAHLGRPDPRDRKELVVALQHVDDRRTTNVLRAALRDADPYVMYAGAAGLKQLGTEKATQSLLDEIDSGVWLRARASLQTLVAMREPRAIPRVIERLERELERVVVDPLDRERIYELGDSLIAFRHTGDVGDLLEGIARQRDGLLKIYLDSMLEQLQVLESYGDDISRWKETLADDDPKRRRLAIEILGELGSDSAAEALVSAFGRVAPEDGVEILRAIGNIDSDATRGLLERVLTEPAFDPYPRLKLREMAAYSARRLGGPRMAKALENAVVRRHGRDGNVLLALILLQGEAAIPVHERFQFDRFRYLKWSRGPEQETIQRLIADLRAGRSVEFYDVPPDEMRFLRPR